MRHQIDTLVLGCTHYPLLKPLLQAIVGDGVQLIDSGHAVAEIIRHDLETYGLTSSLRAAPDRFFATDVGQRVLRVGRTFLGADLDDVALIDL